MLLTIFKNYAGCCYLICLFFYNPVVYASCSGIDCSCSVATTAVMFGNYNPVSATTTTANGNIAVTCSASNIFSAAYEISMDKGNSTTFTTRFMNLAGVHLNYNLYTTAGFVSIWGDGTGGNLAVSDSYTAGGLSQTNNYTVFGRMPALQAVGAGTYSDSILVTVTY